VTQHLAIFEDQRGESRDIRRRNGKASTLELVKDHFYLYTRCSIRYRFPPVIPLHRSIPFPAARDGQRLERYKQWADLFCLNEEGPFLCGGSRGYEFCSLGKIGLYAGKG
jgi:hypothetical protein